MMIDFADPAAGFIAVVTIRLSDRTAIEPLLDLLVEDVREWVRHSPGFLSANYHVSGDESRVLNYAQWESEAAYRASFAANPNAGRLRAAITAIPGVEGLEMVGYQLARSVVAATSRSPI